MRIYDVPILFRFLVLCFRQQRDVVNGKNQIGPPFCQVSLRAPPRSWRVIVVLTCHQLTIQIRSAEKSTYSVLFNNADVISACPQDVKESAYKGLVRLEYGSSVWDPSSILLQEELEKVQKRAARFVTGNFVFWYESIGVRNAFLIKFSNFPFCSAKVHSNSSFCYT